jgi:hypothetical protein
MRTIAVRGCLGHALGHRQRRRWPHPQSELLWCGVSCSCDDGHHSCHDGESGDKRRPVPDPPSTSHVAGSVQRPELPPSPLSRRSSLLLARDDGHLIQVSGIPCWAAAVVTMSKHLTSSYRRRHRAELPNRRGGPQSCWRERSFADQPILHSRPGPISRWVCTARSRSWAGAARRRPADVQSVHGWAWWQWAGQSASPAPGPAGEGCSRCPSPGEDC